MYLPKNFIFLSLFFLVTIANAMPTLNDTIPSSRIKAFKVNDAFQDGEWFRFRMRYGIFNASYADVRLRETTHKGRPVFHASAVGKTTGLARWFFKVDDYYDSFFETEVVKPVHFVRNISEGSYVRHVNIDFDHSTQQGVVNDLLKKTTTRISLKPNVQDLVSTFYYLRNHLDVEGIEPGETASVNMIYGKTAFVFRFRFLGYENISTAFGIVPCMTFRPYVEEGRVFRKDGGLTLWISNDKNRMPIRLKADLRVGSIDVDLESFSGLKHPFNILYYE